MGILNAFDRSTNFWVFTGEVKQQIDPVSKEPVPLRYATDKELLPEKEGFVQGFVTGDWKYYADNRGAEYWGEDGEKHIIKEIGEEVPEGCLLEEPPKDAPTFEELMSAALSNRVAAYNAESNPLYIEWQFDQSEGGEAKWRSKVQEIKSRYPLPVEVENDYE